VQVVVQRRLELKVKQRLKQKVTVTGKHLLQPMVTETLMTKLIQLPLMVILMAR